MKRVHLIAGLGAALVLLTPSAAISATGTIADPAGDQVVEAGEDEGVDVSNVTIKNSAKTITVTLAFHNVSEEDKTEDGFYPAMDTKVIMKWGSGVRKTCTFSNTFVGPEGQCHGDPPPMQSCGGAASPTAPSRSSKSSGGASARLPTRCASRRSPSTSGPVPAQKLLGSWTRPRGQVASGEAGAHLLGAQRARAGKTTQAACSSVA